MGETCLLSSSQLQQFHKGCTCGYPGSCTPWTSGAQFVFPRQKQFYNYLSTWKATTRLTRVVKKTFLSQEKKTNVLSYPAWGAWAPAEGKQPSPRISILPWWGEKLWYKTEWGKRSFHCEWREGSTADSSPGETVQRLFWLFNKVWLSFDPSVPVPEVFCECFRSCSYPWARWLR